MERRLYYSDFL
jgi:hypothetical protein